MPVRATNSRTRCDPFAVADRALSGKPRELARVRRDDRGFAAQYVEPFGEVKERARVDDDRQLVARQELADDRPGTGIETQARSDCNRPIMFRNFEQRFDDGRGGRIVGELDDDLLDEMRAQRGGDAGRRGDGDVAGARARGGARAQHCRARKLRRAGDDERRAGAAFIGRAGAHRQQPRKCIVVEGGKLRGRAQQVLGDSDVGVPKLAGKVARRIEEQPGFYGAEGDGRAGSHRVVADRAGQRVDAGWNVDRDHRVRAQRRARRTAARYGCASGRRAPVPKSPSMPIAPSSATSASSSVAGNSRIATPASRARRSAAARAAETFRIGAA